MNLKKIKEQEEDLFSLQMVYKESFSMIKCMVLVHFNGKMVIFTQEAGLMIKSMEMEH